MCLFYMKRQLLSKNANKSSLQWDSDEVLKVLKGSCAPASGKTFEQNVQQIDSQGPEVPQTNLTESHRSHVGPKLDRQ